MNKKFLTLLLVSGIASLSASSFVWKFSSPEKWTFPKNLNVEENESGFIITIPKSPVWGKKAFEFPLRENKVRIPAGTTQIVLPAKLLYGSGATIGMILIDSEGEHFAFPQKNFPKDNSKIIWDISKPAGSWGKKKNGKIDFPARLAHLAIFQYPSKEPAKILLQNPNGEKKGTVGMVTSAEKIFSFGNEMQWGLSGKNFSYTAADSSVTLQLKPEIKLAKAQFARLHSHEMGLRTIGSPSSLILEAVLESGSALHIGFVILDSQGECFTVIEKGFKPGRNRIEYSLLNVSRGWGKKANNIIDFPVKLIQIFAVQYPTPGPRAKIKLLSLHKKEIKKDVEAVRFEYKTGLSLPVLKVGKEKEFSLQLFNTGDKSVSFQADLVLKHIDGKTLRYSRKFVIPAGKKAEWPMNWNANLPRGVWRAELAFVSSDKLRTHKIKGTSFAYMQPAGPNQFENKEFLTGMNMAQTHYSINDQEKLAFAAALIGCKLLRTGYTWESIERVPGTFDFSNYDRLRNLNAKYGMQHLQLVAYTPQHAVRDKKLLKSKDWNDWNKSAPDADKLEKFTYELVKHNGSKVIWYEFWNEPDLGFWRSDIKTYLECMTRVYRALKKANPNAHLISGGLATEAMAHSKKGFTRAVAVQGQRDFDFYGYHQHGDHDTYRRILDGPVAGYLAEIKPRKQLFLTETGFYTSNGNEPVQAETVLKKIIYSRVYGARGYIWFDLRNDGYEPGYCEHNYGLMTHDYFPKEGYATFNTQCLMLDRAYFSKILIDNKRTSLYSFKRGNDRVLAVWKGGTHGVEESLRFSTDAKKVRFVDWMGNASVLPLRNGKVSFSVPQHPGFIELIGTSKDPVLIPAAVNLTTESVAAIPGRPFNLKLSILNSAKKPASLKLKWKNLPNRVRAASMTKTVPAGKSSVTIPFTLSDKVTSPLHLNLDYTLNDENGCLAFPVNPARLVSARFPAKPHFNLNSRKHVVSQVENNPYTEHRVWKTPADKSAEISLACDDNELRIKVLVIDDKLVRSKTANRSYMEDGIQFALSVPGQKGHWEFGAAVLESGKADGCCWIHPVGMNPFALAVSAKITGNNVEYLIRVPLKKIAVTPALFRQGIQFNLIVNDNDGEGRDGWIQCAPGIGEGKNPELYPFIVRQE